MAHSCFYLLVAQVALLFATGQCRPDFHYKNGLEVVYEWSVVDFAWPSPKERHEAIRNEKYIPLNVFVQDADVFYYNKNDQKSCGKARSITYVVTPRSKTKGIPATLSTVEAKDGKLNPKLKPFPNWEYNRQGNCNGITNAYRTWIDTCQRLWVLDTGTIGANTNGTIERVCQPKIHLFDHLESGGRLVGKFPVPDDVLVCDSFLSYISVDEVHEHGHCDDSYAYITDDYGNGLIVFSLKHKKFTRVVHNSFFPDPQYGDFDVAGTTFQYMDGIIGKSLGPIKDGQRTFYYHAFSSVKQSYVSTAVLRDQEAFRENPRAYPKAFKTFPKRKISQSASDDISPDGILFFDLLSQNALACWNSVRDPHYEQTPIVAQNDTTMQFISSLHILTNRLFAVSSRLQNYYFGSVSPHEINYRLLYGCVPELVRGTACENKEGYYDSHYQSEQYSSHYRSEERYEDEDEDYDY